MDAKTLEELKAKAAQALGARKEDVVVAHVTMTPEPCDHDWGDSEGKLCSVAGLMMCATIGQDEAVARLQGTAAHIAKPKFSGAWKMERAN